MNRDNVPTKIRLREQGAELALDYADGSVIQLDAEFLRVHSPSAEVQGHGGVGGTLPTGKRHVRIAKVQPVGRYALGIQFNDGHDSGIFTWDYLKHLAHHRESLWETYLRALREQGKGREADVQILRLQ